jgi:alpha-galactosidase
VRGAIEAVEAGTASAVVEVDRGAHWRWWGLRVPAGRLPALDDARPPASFSLDRDQPLPLVPTAGGGWFGAPALVVRRAGATLVPDLSVAEVRRDGEALAIRLIDVAGGLTVVQMIARRGDALLLSAAVTNMGDTPLDLDWLAAGTLPLPADSVAIRSFTGRHNAEFVEVREPMPAHGWIRENRRGLTGHAGPPGLFVEAPGATWHAGTVRAAQLAWPGDHRLLVERDDEGFWTLQMGEALGPGGVGLAPGATYTTPEMIAVVAADGMNGAIQAFHAAVRARLPWHGGAMRRRPVHLNSWEGFYFDHDEPALMALATRAAALGVERFVLDDGWFKGRGDDTAALGDWTPDPMKYPRGLGPLADHVVALGMEFGLWVEPEMVNPDSDLFRAHPDWALQVADRPLVTARHQLVLDMSRADVRDHLFGVLDGLLRTLPIAYLKWDHNRDLAPAGRTGGEGQVRGAYALLDRLLTAHPALEIEACAGGGGRIDAGIAQRSHRFWTSDNIDATLRTAIQRGFLHFMPPEVMGAHVGASPAHATGRAQSMAFRGAVALPGHFGIELDPAELNQADAAGLVEAVARYKGLRDRLHTGRVWLGEAPDGLVWQAHGERDDLLLFVTRTAPATFRRPPPLVLPMLHDAGAVRVRLLTVATAPGHPAPDAPLFAAMRDGAVVLDGGWLAEAGLPTPAMKAESVALFRIEAA